MTAPSRWRVAAFAAVLLLTLGAAVAIWMLLHRAPQARPVLTLRVNRGEASTIQAGTPLIFEAFLTATTAGRAVSVGSAARPWHGMIRLESIDGRALPWAVVDVGAPRSTIYAREKDGRPSPRVTRDSVATLSGLTSVHVVTRGVPPEVSERTPPRVYQVRAVLSPPWWMFWRWHHDVRSAPVTVTVTAPAADGEGMRLRLRETAAFDLAARRYAEARRAVDALLQADPRSADAYAIRGEALEREGNAAAAVEAYRQAMALQPPSGEEPLYLERRLEAAMRAAGDVTRRR